MIYAHGSSRSVRKFALSECFQSRLVSVDDRQLAKVNTVTLMAWLKQRGVVYKAKDKKSDLVDKVLHTVHLSASEQ